MISGLSRPPRWVAVSAAVKKVRRKGVKADFIAGAQKPRADLREPRNDRLGTASVPARGGDFRS